MKTSDLQPGDIIAISTPKGFLPKSIRLFMWMWSAIRYRKLPRGRLYNHAMVVYQFPLVAEAVAKGFTVNDFNEHYPDLSRLIVFRLKAPLTGLEKIELCKKVLQMAYGNIAYEYLNFLWWPLYILSNGKCNLSPKGSQREKKVFCFEAAAMLIEAARPGTFPDPSKVTTVDLQNDDRFEQIYFDSYDSKF